MKAKLLFVDDEKDLLAFFSAVFEGEHEVRTAEHGEAALSLLAEEDGFAVIVSDLNMPGMDGITFLEKVRERAPGAICMMLTGFATRDTAIAAVNKGDVFRFLTKPIRVADLKAAMHDALRRYELDQAEKELMEQTVRGSVSMLMDVLAMAEPVVFGRASARRTLVERLCHELGDGDAWVLETSALLCNLGILAVPQVVLHRYVNGGKLSENDIVYLHEQATVSADLVRQVPRLEPVAEAIALQYKNYDGSGYPDDCQLARQALPLGARVLRVVNDFGHLQAQGISARQAVELLQEAPGPYDRRILKALAVVAKEDVGTHSTILVDATTLRAGSVLAQDLTNRDGVLIVRAGQEISDYLAQRLRSFARDRLIADKVAVRLES